MWTLRLPMTSQVTARRNAQRAAIECGIRRQQREDVERFLRRRRQETPVAAPTQAGRQPGRGSGLTRD